MLRKTPVLILTLFSSLSIAACHRAQLVDNNATDTDAMVMPDPIAFSDAQKEAIKVEFPAPYNAADLAEGEKEFVKCRACHTITPDKMNMTGPHLYGVFGRKSGTVSGYTFTEAMTQHGVVWGFDTLDTYLTSPQTVVKGTKMGFPGIADATKRHNLIAYLALETQPHPEVNNAATSSQSAP